MNVSVSPSSSLSASGCVTVSNNARSEDVDRARLIAEACGLPFVSREAANQDPLVIIERTGARLTAGQTGMRSHPGMGLVRLRRLVKGKERDPLIDLAELCPGDAVLDATFGFGQDALVLAHGIQPGGCVVGLEASPLLAALAMAGMSHWPRPASTVAEAIRLTCADYRRYLATAESRSFDVVYFDPMFRRPKSAAPDFTLLRQLADHTPLTRDDIDGALRVARRMVVVKDAWPGNELRRLGLQVSISRRSAEIAYGWLRV